MFKKTLNLTLVSSAAMLMTGCVVNPPQPDTKAYEPAPPQPVVIEQPSTAGAIFNASTAMNLYGDMRAHRVGDVITIKLEEKTSSSKSNSTSVDKNQYTGIAGGTWAGTPIKMLGKPLDVNYEGGSSFAGSGATDMSNSLKGDISVVVQEVRPNGTLYVRGEKWLTLNQGDEYIRISGIVRDADISNENIVSSTKLADARITYSGKGAMQDSNTMGWLSRFFVSPFWPL